LYERERRILTVLGLSSIACGTVLAVQAEHGKTNPRTWRRVAGSVFVSGFVLLGVALHRWQCG
jgi:hypothetical protein